MAAKPLCSIPGCDKPVSSLGMCSAHLGRFRRHGDPLAGRTFHGEPEKFYQESLAYEGDDCLLWPFWLSQDGYGRWYTRGRKRFVSRLICEEVYGPPPSPQHETAHSCVNRACINPRHLRWATHVENCADKFEHGTAPLGEKHANAKLTDSQVRAIKALGPHDGHRQVAERYGVSRDNIYKIRTGRAWAWIE